MCLGIAGGYCLDDGRGGRGKGICIGVSGWGVASISSSPPPWSASSPMVKDPATQQVLFIEPATPIGTGSVLRGPA